jgi:hypothetical protein
LSLTSFAPSANPLNPIDATDGTTATNDPAKEEEKNLNGNPD